MNNYEFCADFARRSARGGEFKVLDYGCGSGPLLQLLLRDGLDAYGCDSWYEGGDISHKIPAEIRSRIFTMQGDRIPFPDGTFDLVISNQVLEHVIDLDAVLAEMARVMKPGAVCLALFPHLEVWREGHTNIPFLHWFPKNSKSQIYYAFALRSLGLGYFKEGGGSPMQWAARSCKWLADWCHYRPRADLESAFTRHISVPTYIEADWMTRRMPKTGAAPKWLRTVVARKAAGLVLTAARLS